jgi:glycogen(starch) synthase
MLSNLFPPGFIGGYELGAFDTARGLVASGHEVEVLTSDYFPDDAGVLIDLPVRRILQCAGLNRIPSDHAGLADNAAFIVQRNLRLLAAEIARFKPDRVLCFNIAGLGAWGMLQFLVAAGYRPVLFLMDNVFEAMAASAGRRASFTHSFGAGHWLDQVHCVFMSQNLRHEVETALGLPLTRSSLIPGWTNPDPAAAVAAEPWTLSHTGDGPLRFIFASRITGHKGIDTILAAARALLDRGQGEFRIDVFGAGEVAQMLQNVAALQLQDHVHYMGCPPKETLLASYADYHALLFPTWPREPFGFVVSEAAVAGCLPVMTAGIGAAEWFLNGQDALLIRNDEKGVVTAMLQLMLMPAAERDAMRRRARQTALRFFAFPAALSRLEAVLAASTGATEAQGPIDVRRTRAAEAALSILTEVWRSSRHD